MSNLFYRQNVAVNTYRYLPIILSHLKERETSHTFANNNYQTEEEKDDVVSNFTQKFDLFLVVIDITKRFSDE